MLPKVDRLSNIVNVSSFIARRLAFNRQKTFSRFIIRLSLAATVISVAVMIITLAFVNGFQETVSDKVFSFWGHIRIGARQPSKASIAEEEPINKNDSLARWVKDSVRGVESVYPFATKYAILKTADEMEGVLMKGYDSTYNFSHLQQFLQSGRWINFNDSSYSREIVVSTYTANQLNLKLNERILLYFIGTNGRLRPDKLTIVGIYKTGIEEYDKTFAIGDLKLIRQLNQWDTTLIGGYEIFLTDYKRMDSVSNKIYEESSIPITWETRTVREIYPNIFDWLQIIDTNSAVLITIMIVIAIINLITCLIILVLERIRMIGILKALGASDWMVQKIFLNQSLLVTGSAIAGGVVLALLILFLQQWTGFIRLPEDAYYMDRAAVKIVWWHVVAVAVGTMLVSVLVLLIPSYIVRKVQPIKAIRFS